MPPGNGVEERDAASPARSRSIRDVAAELSATSRCTTTSQDNRSQRSRIEASVRFTQNIFGPIRAREYSPAISLRNREFRTSISLARVFRTMSVGVGPVYARQTVISVLERAISQYLVKSIETCPKDTGLTPLAASTHSSQLKPDSANRSLMCIARSSPLREAGIIAMIANTFADGRMSRQRNTHKKVAHPKSYSWNRRKSDDYLSRGTR